MLARAIQSVQAQTDPDWELVVYDVSAHPAHIPADPRIRLVRGDKPRGPAADFQRALEHTTGNIVMPLSDDDELSPDTVQTVNAEIGDARWLVARTELRNQNGTIDGYRGGPVHVEMTRNGEYMLGGAVAWRRELDGLAGGFDSEYESAGDFDLYLRFLALAEPRVIEDVLYIRHDHSNTDSSRNARRQGLSAAKVRARLCAS